MNINQTECQTDRIKTDALLRGVKVIDYNQLILDMQKDLDTLRELTSKHGLLDTKMCKDMESKIHIMERQCIDWLDQAGITHKHRDYAITILIEEVKT